MIDLTSYSLAPRIERLQRLRRSKSFADTEAMMIQAVDSADLLDEARRPRSAPTGFTSSRSGLPVTGARPVAGPNDRSPEDEWPRARAVSGKGGGAPAPAVRAPAPIRSAPSPSPSPIEKKAALASGAQAAVVKLASYGSGSTRAAALLNYQSDKGQLSLEREDGTLVTGKSAVADLAAHWRGDDGREPSNDVFRLEITFDDRVSEEEARAALSKALDGYHFAWRLEDHRRSTTLDLVVVAAGSGRDDHGKRDRIYANEKSQDRFFDKVSEAFGREADFSKPAWAHGEAGATTLLAGMTKAGQLTAETDSGLSITARADQLYAKQPSSAKRPKPENFNPNLQLAKSWRPAMRSTSPRDFAHVILSAKPGTDKEAFMDAARATLAKEFAGHEYVFTMHTNRQHIHVHAAVRLTSPTGEKLHPGIQDFNRWRETLAHEARERHIPMQAVRRFDQAHAPAYKLKDMKMMEAGIAPESVRRRIERVKNREIHRPTREEGRKRAIETAAQWKTLVARQAVSLPALASGAVRLYRAEAVGSGAHRAALFATERSLAESYVQAGSSGRLLYLDIPSSEFSKLTASRTNPTKMFVVPKTLESLIKALSLDDQSAIIPFQTRAEAALSNTKVNRQKDLSSEEKTMRTADTMEAARSKMEDAYKDIGARLPDGELKNEFLKRSGAILDAAQKATEQQRRLEKSPAQIEGDSYVKPEAQNLASFITHERKGSEIHYYRNDAKTGAFQTLAFIDNGKQLEVRDWNNPDSVNAALKLAAQKWDTITVNGSDQYKEQAARLAAEHGYKLANPELQERIQAIRSEIEAKRANKQQTEAGPILTTPAERSVELNIIRERVDREAERETQQAGRAARAQETNAATGSEETPYRSQEEAKTAREAERAVDGHPARAIPSDPRQSEAIQNLRHEQRRVLEEDQREQQRRMDIEDARQRLEQERTRPREESEGETR